MSNRTVLNYHESLLRSSDVDLLKGHFWLNDTIISFYFEYLEIECFKRDPMLLFVPPDVTQCIKMVPYTEISVFLSPLNADNRDFIFFALNNNEETGLSGGTHWSLLVFSYPEKTVFHYDSSRGTNEQQAVELGLKLLRYFGLAGDSGIIEADCLQQSNGYDCGIHVLCYAEHLAAYARKYGVIGGCPPLERSTVRGKREEILNVINYLRQR